MGGGGGGGGGEGGSPPLFDRIIPCIISTLWYVPPTFIVFLAIKCN